MGTLRGGAQQEEAAHRAGSLRAYISTLSPHLFPPHLVATVQTELSHRAFPARMESSETTNDRNLSLRCFRQVFRHSGEKVTGTHL